MTNLMSVDQSLSKCACTIWGKDGEAKQLVIYKTGNSKVKNKLEGVSYFDTVEEQIKFITDSVSGLAEIHGIDTVIFEALSFGSIGNATRDLAQLFGALIDRLNAGNGVPLEQIHKLPPTTLKSFARRLLPEDEQFQGKTAANKPKYVKMDKKLMVKSAQGAGGADLLEGLKMSGKNAGLDDAADSYLLGLYYNSVIK